jgi:YD repeat-containing protein
MSWYVTTTTYTPQWSMGRFPTDAYGLFHSSRYIDDTMSTNYHTGWDKNGNPIQKTDSGGTTFYTWNSANELIRIDLPDGSAVTYKYDPLGRRIEKNVNGTVAAYLYDLSTILLELDSEGTVRARYTHGPGVDRPLMVERNDQAYFYHADGQGNIAIYIKTVDFYIPHQF